jgi:hypothetical protein
MIPFVGTPIWLVSLILAAIAPFCVRSVADAFERALRRRTLDAIARATLEAATPNNDSPEGAPARAPHTEHNERAEAARIEEARGEAPPPVRGEEVGSIARH